ncbi:leukocyte elastase inhibitor-like [Toxorhynchites rutilus septentrionalis]|uniref:leukocyte elastase inhibitor-like n=1 Tax=Toxorhynchites rutilus septentrionalis TaxID=329112 RepID=UPI00247A1421|nr:leukocyte elastase inhibitor-like [Toxorhynchites rutilus septentrionalis]
MAKLLLILTALVIAGAQAELSDFTTSSTRFGFDFFKKAYNPSENAILSPLSIHSSLSMFYQLAGEKVTPEMQKHLYLPTDKSKAADDLRNWLAAGQDSNKNADALKTRSKIYHTNAKLKPDVIPLLHGQFGAEVESADFTEAEQVVRSVNAWVDQATGGLIKEFMDAGDVRDDNDLMLLNVVALSASWRVPFDPTHTEKTTFHFVNGDHDADMMYLEGDFPYTLDAENHCYAVELEYSEDTDLSMVLILPTEEHTLEQVVQRLSLDMYIALDSSLRSTKATVTIPKFTMRMKLDAKEQLKEMGLKAMFEKLDLNILARDKSRLGEVKQMSFIKVDEKGTEAVAATEIQAVGRSGGTQFIANRPFLYLIRKRSNKNIIFIGHFSVHES